ncbi:MAG TPA: thioredoxin family protein, partial [Pilimelia sp.]|nr:thioredoxin family protein [Pilimelia sp.]
AAATAFGLWRRGHDGRLLPVTAAGQPTGAAGQPTGAAGQPTPAAGRDGDAAAPAVHGRAAPPVAPELLAALGVVPGQVTLLQFSTAFCAPCRVTRRVCGEVARLLDGVRHVEVDAVSHLDAVRALGVWRTPTLLILDGAGRVVQRAVGAPTTAQVVAAVAPLLPAAVTP